MGFNSGFKGLKLDTKYRPVVNLSSPIQDFCLEVVLKSDSNVGIGKVHPRTGHESPKGE